MNRQQAKENKRIKLLRIVFFISIVLIFLSIGQIIFESADNFHKVLQWLQLIVWSVATIFSWFHYKEVKEKLQGNPEKEII